MADLVFCLVMLIIRKGKRKSFMSPFMITSAAYFWRIQGRRSDLGIADMLLNPRSRKYLKDDGRFAKRWMSSFSHPLIERYQSLVYRQ